MTRSPVPRLRQQDIPLVGEVSIWIGEAVKVAAYPLNPKFFYIVHKYYPYKAYIFLRNVLTNSVAQEPEGSSPHSQQPATGPCPETVESNLHPPSQSP
jgi:hypothetical protein